jgi:hypothetical protein
MDALGFERAQMVESQRGVRSRSRQPCGDGPDLWCFWIFRNDAAGDVHLLAPLQFGATGRAKAFDRPTKGRAMCEESRRCLKLKV